MIISSGAERFEDGRCVLETLTFKDAADYFERENLPFGPPQMRSLGILEAQGAHSNLGLILSDQSPYVIKAAVFADNRQSNFQDRRVFAGSLFSQMEEAYGYVDKWNQLRSTFEGLRRDDARDYPPDAVREALLNLLVHRDYAVSADSFIKVYSDRMEFASLGSLVDGLTLEDALSGVSVCRNPKLAEVFYRLRLIEAYGTGLEKIVSAYDGLPCQPGFHVTENVFKVVLPNRNAFSGTQTDRDAAPAPPQVSPALRADEQLLGFARAHGQITRQDVERLLDVSQATGGRLLRRLVGAGKLTRIGSGRASRYAPLP